jgi:hypothetical protein
MTKATTLALLPALLASAAGGALAQSPAATGGSAAVDVAAVNQRIDQLLGDHTRYEPVIHAFQQAMAAKDAAAVAALVAYPLRVKLDGKPATIRDARDFVAHYAAIVTPAMAAAIGRQRYGSLFVNDQGVMFGNGEAWINGICRDASCKRFDVKVVALQP